MSTRRQTQDWQGTSAAVDEAEHWWQPAKGITGALVLEGLDDGGDGRCAGPGTNSLRADIDVEDDSVVSAAGLLTVAVEDDDDDDHDCGDGSGGAGGLPYGACCG